MSTKDMLTMCQNSKTLLSKLKPAILAYKVDRLNEWAIKHKLTIKGMAGEKLIITDQATGEEYVVKNLGYPF